MNSAFGLLLQGFGSKLLRSTYKGLGSGGYMFDWSCSRRALAPLGLAVAGLCAPIAFGQAPPSKPIGLTSVANATAACAALNGKVIPASAIGVATGGAVVTATAYKLAVADAPRAPRDGGGRGPAQDADAGGPPGAGAIVQGTPDLCQVQIDIKPVDPAAPLIKVQLNLPTAWNGKSLQMGGSGTNGFLVNGLGAARIAGPETALPVTRGFMTLGTDSGHQSGRGVEGAAFALNDEALTNYAFAAYKKTHDVGVQVGLAYYGRRAARSYYIGGSEGGREAMAMAQRYPADFDGIVALDPVIRLIGLWQRQYGVGPVQMKPNAWLGGKTQLIHDTVASACDAIDGIRDNVVSNYVACKPLAEAALAARRCAAGADDGANCLSDGQLATLRWYYNDMPLPVPTWDGLKTYPSYLYGSEGIPGFDRYVVGNAAPGTDPDAPDAHTSFRTGISLIRYLVTRDPKFDLFKFSPADYAERMKKLSLDMDMNNPDLSAFQARGGKLIMRESLSDKGNSPQSGIDYYNAVVAKMGKSKVDTFFVAYGASGLGHTSPGVPAGTRNAPIYGTPGQIDLLGLIDDWVVNGNKPGQGLVLTSRQPMPPYDIIASKPMCRLGSYPQYVGASPAGGNLATNYVCTPF